ncbi:MAG TPA: NAD-dependent epimerase/dehydratase family protein [Polyangiaceae bacterium]|nr:NAD-dependent epimerase/dehydratase family protein [Polyangiaceae bacterium]
MRTVFITGAAGVMGTRLTARLRKAGWNVRALVMPGDPLRSRVDRLGCEVREGDISDASSLRGACDGVDLVYHLAAVIISHDPSVFQRVNRDGTANVVAEAQRSGVGHFVYVSSASVTYPRRTRYAESKLEAERIVASAGIPYTIVRPTLVYEQGGAQEIMMFLDYLKRYPIVPFIGTGGALKRPVWSEDVVDGLSRLAGARIAHGKIYNFSGGEAISMRELAELLLQYHDRPRPVLPLPVFACRAAAALLSVLMKKPPLTSSAIAGIVNDANLDPSEAMRDLGYAPLGVRAGFQHCFSNAQTRASTFSTSAMSIAKGQVR